MSNKQNNVEQLVIQDQTIIAFYKENPNLDFVTMNHIFIDILKKISTNLNETLTNSINQKILSMLTDLSKDISGFKMDISSKLIETKKEYIDNIKLILENSSLSNNEKIQAILDKNGESVILKTTSIINEIMPKHNNNFIEYINNSIKQLYDNINQDTNKLIENINKDDKNLSEFVSNIDTKFTTMISNLQQPLVTYMQSSEERTSNNIQQIRDKLIAQQLSQDTLNSEINDFLNKYKHNSSIKGNISETELYPILQNIFVSDEIINCSTETASCDYRINRLNQNKPTILFENKDYSRSVTTEEIKKFERDLKIQNSHGIFLSHKSNITYKEPFQIDIINNLIHMYIPNVNYNIDKIKIAVEIIDTLAPKLIVIKNEPTTINISKEDIDELLETHNEFYTQKLAIIENIKTSNKLIIDKLESMHINSVKKILTKNNMLQNEEDFKCKYCNVFNGKNKASLGAHIRNCKLNPINK